MHRFHLPVVFSVIFPALISTTIAADPADTYATRDRALWTTSRVIGSPEPPAKYVTRVAFPELKFDEPLAFAIVPDLDRIGIAERRGKLFTIPNDTATESRTLLLDLKRAVMGLAFHPDFASNGKFYVTSIPDHETLTDTGTRVSEFQVSDRSAMTADIHSERVLIEWPNGGHNGGCIRFGPDGYL